MPRSLRWWFPTLLLLLLPSLDGTLRAETPDFCPGSDPEVKKLLNELMEGRPADWTCEPEAWTTMGRLPAVRMVVYDPVSSSFSYVSVCPNEGHNTDNLDYQDRRRLALPTQKIRLLVLPYNPAAGKVEIVATDGNGIEIQETATAGAPSATGPAAPKTEEEKKKDKEREKEQTEKESETKPAQPSASEKAKEKELLKAMAAPPLISNSMEDLTTDLEVESEASAPRLDRLAALISASNEKYFSGLDNEYDALLRLRAALSCVDRQIDNVTRTIGLDLVNGHLFTIAQDAPLCAVMEEVLRRQNLIRDAKYAGCPFSKPGSTFEDDTSALEGELLRLNGEFAKLKRLRSALEDSLRSARVIGSQISKKEVREDWNEWIQHIRGQVDDAQEFQKVVEKDFPELANKLTGVRTRYGALQIGQAERAPLQRMNYNPRQNGQSITFAARTILPDGHPSPAVANLAIMSAPAYNVRFGMGVIASGLDNPSFKAGPENANGKKTVQFAEEENNQILPVITVHHYWGKRSPVLSGTWFERLMPTFTLGIPVAKANLLEQAIFGFTWDLTAGVDLSMGVHVGKVNSLAGYKVGQEIDSKLDVSTIQKKKYDQAFYFGILLNSDLFGSLFNAQKKPQ